MIPLRANLSQWKDDDFLKIEHSVSTCKLLSAMDSKPPTMSVFQAHSLESVPKNLVMLAQGTVRMIGQL